MPGTNQFLPFAVGAGANTLTPTAYAALASLLANGFVAGVANSAQFNTAMRQATTAAAGLAQFIANQGPNVNDDGSPSNFASSLLTALQAMFAPKTSAWTRAWVTFNGFTGAILASYNVSSITKVATGVYEINFAAPMSDANYGFSGSCGEQNGTSISSSNPGGNNMITGGGASGTTCVRTVNKLRVYAWEAGTSPATEDATAISVHIWGN